MTTTRYIQWIKIVQNIFFQGKGVAPSDAPRCCSYWKREPSGHPQLRWINFPFTYIYIYIYIYMCVCVCVCVVLSVSFMTFLYWAFKIVADSWKTSMLLLYILYDNGPFSMISVSKEQLPQELEYNILKPYCHSWWISTMQSGRTICNKSLF